METLVTIVPFLIKNIVVFGFLHIVILGGLFRVLQFAANGTKPNLGVILHETA